MRVFIAAELDEAGVSAASRLIERLRRLDSKSVKWVGVGNLHITLKFLGDVSEAQARAAGEIMAEATGDLPQKEMRFEGIGMFPSERRPRVVHLKVSDPDGFLATLSERIERGVNDRIGLPLEDRPFVPHLTLCRARGERISPVLARALGEFHPEIQSAFRLAAVTLFESILRPEGPIYKPLLRKDARDRKGA